MADAVISIARDFSRFPSGRFRTDGPHNGQEFREAVLLPALSKAQVICIDLDGVAGLPASFLEEAFGGLVRSGFSKSNIRSRIKIIASSPRLQRYPAQIYEYIENAREELAHAG
ncbi:STAS-like domain-containing protein [Methylobacterium pseudosasicola]|uniref:STAS-like domain-containing protein n=1 Tax=Methylobacterium pseudosasicola TaxID=582667 RepID=UPI000B83D1D6|nr:STAS-like domain-containing protein [Methylobacterium pseudosasicola]